jgi:hypothetical protein
MAIDDAAARRSTASEQENRQTVTAQAHFRLQMQIGNAA